jgi:hypothetical protein
MGCIAKSAGFTGADKAISPGLNPHVPGFVSISQRLAGQGIERDHHAAPGRCDSERHTIIADGDRPGILAESPGSAIFKFDRYQTAIFMKLGQNRHVVEDITLILTADPHLVACIDRHVAQGQPVKRGRQAWDDKSPPVAVSMKTMDGFMEGRLSFCRP